MYIRAMVKEFLMKKLLISLGVFACVTVNAQTASDSVVMTVAGKQVPLSEFIFIAEKNGEVDLSNTKSVKNYVELFKNFKLKVAEAESLGIDQTSSFKSELDGYRAQLINSYMSDKEGEKAAARAVYDRGGSLGRVDPHLIPFAGEDGLQRYGSCISRSHASIRTSPERRGYGNSRKSFGREG